MSRSASASVRLSAAGAAPTATAANRDRHSGSGHCGDREPAVTTAAGEHVFGGGALDLDTAETEWLEPTVDVSFGTGDAWRGCSLDSGN